MKTHILGIYGNDKVVESTDSLHELKHTMRGFFLTELKIESSINSEKDIDNFIELLINLKPCFNHKPVRK